MEFLGINNWWLTYWKDWVKWKDLISMLNRWLEVRKKVNKMNWKNIDFEIVVKEILEKIKGSNGISEEIVGQIVEKYKV